MNNFRTIDRQTGFLLPPSVDEWLPEKHLARFVVEVIDGMDLRAMSGSYRGSGSASYHPRMLLGILVYGYATGIFSSRKLERATYDSVAFRFIAANDHPDHDTICQCGAGIPCRCNDGDEMDAEAEKHIRPIEAMLAGKLPPAETFELNMPAGATQGMLLREVRRIQEALVAWIVETAPKLPISTPSISRKITFIDL